MKLLSVRILIAGESQGLCSVSLKDSTFHPARSMLDCFPRKTTHCKSGQNSTAHESCSLREMEPFRFDSSS